LARSQARVTKPTVKGGLAPANAVEFKGMGFSGHKAVSPTELGFGFVAGVTQDLVALRVENDAVRADAIAAWRSHHGVAVALEAAVRAVGLW